MIFKKYGSFGRIARRKPFVVGGKTNGKTSEKYVQAMFGHNAQLHVWQNPNKAYQHKHLVSTVRHDLVLLPQDLRTLQLLSQPWAPLYTKVF